jgi:hypothetical protein
MLLDCHGGCLHDRPNKVAFRPIWSCMRERRLPVPLCERMPEWTRTSTKRTDTTVPQDKPPVPRMIVILKLIPPHLYVSRQLGSTGLWRLHGPREWYDVVFKFIQSDLLRRVSSVFI